MKAHLLFFVYFIFCCSVLHAGFTPGNFVVVRIGDGSPGLTAGRATPTFLLEYTPSGTLVQTIALPTTVSGANKRLLCNGASLLEGTLNISADRKYLTICGYDADPYTSGGTAVGGITSGGTGIDNSAPNLVNRVIGLIDFNGNINTTTALNDAYDKANIRSAVTDYGTNIWSTGSFYVTTTATSGLRYFTTGSTTSTKISTSENNLRVAGIGGGQLYVTSGASPFKTMNTIGTGLSTTAGQIISPVAGMPNLTHESPMAFVFFDMDGAIPGPDLLYICDDDNPDTKGVQGVSKYAFNGSTWEFKGRIKDECTGITGYLDCNNRVILFITSNNNMNNKVFKFTDGAVYNSLITDNGLSLSAVGTVVVSGAGSQCVFRGIQMVPGDGRIITPADPQNITAGSYHNIMIKNGSTAILTGNISISEKMVVEPGASLDCGNYTISSVAGTSGYFDLQKDATIKMGSANGIQSTAMSGNVQTCLRRFHSGGIYKYNGATAQVTGNGLPSVISGKLVLNNGNNIELSSPLLLSGILHFENGKLKTDVTNVITVTTASQYISAANQFGGTNQGHQASYINGPALYQSSANTLKVLPIGNDSLFAPVFLTPYDGTAKTYTAQYFYQEPTDQLHVEATLDHISKHEYWLISCDVVTSPLSNVKIGLSWRPQSFVPTGVAGDSVEIWNKFKTAHYVDMGGGKKWLMDGAGMNGFTKTGNLSYGVIYAETYTTLFSPFTLATSSSLGTLPVRIISWDVERINNTVKMRWQTDGSEAASLIIERSTDGEHFSKLITKSLDEGNIFTDENPAAGWNYYRLTVLEKSGIKTMSKVKKVRIDAGESLVVFPNPATNNVWVNLSGVPGTLTLTDATGKIVQQTFTKNEKRIRLLVGHFPKVLYWLRYQTGQAVSVFKLVIQ